VSVKNNGDQYTSVILHPATDEACVQLCEQLVNGAAIANFVYDLYAHVVYWPQKSGLFRVSIAHKPSTLVRVERTGVTRWKSSLGT
jgi:hypothetical protein